MLKGSARGVLADWFGLCVPLLMLMLQSCANTPFGQEFANSFDAPTQEPLPVAPVSSDPEPTNSSSKSRAPDQDATNSEASTPQTSRPVEQKPELPGNPVTPQPYRITIKLSGADPSAPAEAVTQALRMAGVNFEVETIERVKDQSLIRVPPSGMGEQP